jgi:hypothetical protein
MKKYYIPLGCDCHPAGILGKLRLRKESLPFDWMLISTLQLFNYINTQIQNKFIDYLDEPEYNKNKISFSKKYPNALFYHQDIFNEEIRKTLKNRAQKFINILNRKNCIIYFFTCIDYNSFEDLSIDKKKILYEDIQNFKNNNIKAIYKLIIYFRNDNNDFNLELPEYYKKSNNIVFEKYIRNKSVSKHFGAREDFLPIVTKNKF